MASTYLRRRPRIERRRLSAADLVRLPGSAFQRDELPDPRIGAQDAPGLDPAFSLNANALPRPGRTMFLPEGPNLPAPDTAAGILETPVYPPEFKPTQEIPYTELSDPFAKQPTGMDVEGEPVGFSGRATSPSDERKTYVNSEHGFGSPTALALLSAGLGILANNTGHYGQAGPAIGKGGLIGLNTFTQLKQQQADQRRQEAQMSMQRDQHRAYQRQVAAQELRAQRDESQDNRKQALMRMLTEMPENDPNRGRVLERLMLESGQFPAYFKAQQGPATRAPKPMDEFVNDENGQPVLQGNKQLIKRTVYDKDGNPQTSFGWKAVGGEGTKIVMPPGEKAFTTTLSSAEAKDASSISDLANKAYGARDTVQGMLDYARKWKAAGGDLGKLANLQTFWSGMSQALGIRPEAFGLPKDPGPAEALRGISNSLVLSKLGGEGGMPAQNFSNADREFLERMKPQLDDSPRGFVLKLMVEDAVARRAIEKQDLWETVRDQFPENEERKAYREFQRQWRRYVKDRPLFSAQDQREMEDLTVQLGGRLFKKPPARGPVFSPDVEYVR